MLNYCPNGLYEAEALIAQPEFSSRTIIDENLVLIELEKIEVYIDAPYDN